MWLDVAARVELYPDPDCLRLKRRASAWMASNISKDLLAERNTLIGSRAHHLRTPRSALSSQLSLIISRLIAMWRPPDHLVLFDPSRDYGCLRTHCPFLASSTTQLMLILCGDCMEKCWPDRQSSQSITTAKGVIGTHTANSSITLSKHRLQQLQLEDAISPWWLLS
ncbi:hypothetical protein BU25DRAFT_152045 [Macroventuria anomochaeta]|uniref:Uncharacterized protein n=1 Tax=Macroventuria anomochaeta TaxID=301207 RepID=A0ACB6SGQ9_9PLEO|nr:uncharacterized protein BU25DRAFT_152045 [Macroventuria anomochaeta]KAF2632454.1 hypothetical protein BU25DRAFT_152045 [Macroventuria anomochaeta]